MALQWVEVGSLKGSKGDQGPQGPAGTAGRSMRAATQDIAPDSDVSANVIHPSDNIQTGDLIMDTAGELYQVTSVADGSVHVAAAVTGVNLRGPQGDQGPRGPQGEKGADGRSFTLKGSKPSTGSLPQDGSQQIGDAWLVTGDLYVWDGSQWNNAGDIQGPRGSRMTVGTAPPVDPGIEGDSVLDVTTGAVYVYRDE